MDDLDDMYDDHPSLDASLEDFESNTNNHRRSPLFELPSQHSGFRSESEEGEMERESNERWSPPGFRPHDYVPNSGWYRHQPYVRRDDHGDARSRRSSPALSPEHNALVAGAGDVGDLTDVTIAANVPLPLGTDSPLKGRSPSPDPVPKVESIKGEGNEEEQDNEAAEPGKLSNYIRFALSAEVQHREPFYALSQFLRSKVDSMTSSKTNMILSIVIALLSLIIMRTLLLPPLPQAVPDLVKLSGLARSFEPLIYYSENGVQQVGTLQETGVAVWDLGESVRGTNMTSAPIIVRQLDELSESLKSLSLELTRFFANVDSDIDSILIVMDWAKRELQTLTAQPPSSLPTIMVDNLHTMLSYLGSLERLSTTGDDESDSGDVTSTPTALGKIVTTILGPTSAQRTRATLVRTFTEFLNVLEESINSELTHSTALFALFESIDHQFLNLQRTVVREFDAQEREEGEMLSSLWTRVLGADSALVRKYEKNKRLLASVRSRTVANKHLLVDHRGRLLTLKVNLETLRRKLVSPLVRRNDSVSFVGVGDGRYGGLLNPVEAVVAGQIRGIESTYEYLQGIREKQKAKLMEIVYGSGRRSMSGNSILGIEPDGTLTGGLD